MKSPEQELMDFLLENPHLAPFQAKIKKTLDLAGQDPEKRLEAFSKLVEGNKVELQENMEKLLGSIVVLEGNMMKLIGGKFQ